MSVVLQKKLIYRASYRGTKESDLVLGPYAKTHTSSMTEDQLAVFDALLQETDANIRDWLEGKAEAPSEYKCMINDIKDYLGWEAQ